MDIQKFSWRARLRSFVYAYQGLAWFFRREHNARIHGIAAIAAVIVSLLLHISRLEFIAVLLAIALVFVAEMCNTAIEKILDHLSPAYNPAVKTIKDIAAAAVLVAAIIAAVIGLLVFIPRILFGS